MNIRNSIIVLFLLTSSIFATEVNSTQAIKQEGIKYIKTLGMALKSELKKRMQEDKSGLKAAEFCANKASEITANINNSLPKNIKVRRTALKYRNEVNKPDTTDIKVMQYYINKIKENNFSPKDIKVVDVNGTKRVYKPLIVQQVCLKCHGSNISPQIKEQISKFYPHDKAIGFKKGDLRGVIVAEIKDKK